MLNSTKRYRLDTNPLVSQNIDTPHDVIVERLACMQLSKTAQAETWLRQFNQTDRQVASVLLDSIMLVEGGFQISQIRHRLKNHLENVSPGHPAVVVPVLSREDMIIENDSIVDESEEHAEPTVFLNFNPTQRLDSNPGSEALIAHAIREVARDPSVDALTSDLTLSAIRSAKSRDLMFVTDFIGSGRQVLRYVDAWFRNKSIKSWYSLKYIKTQIISYAATSEAHDLLNQHPFIDNVDVAEIAPTIHLKPDSLQQKIKDLCVRYAKLGGLKKPPLGYKNSLGLFLSTNSIPNNLPSILIESSAQWNALFINRAVTSSIAGLIGLQRPEHDVVAQIAAHRQSKIARRLSLGAVNPRWELYVSMLAISPSTVREAALELNISYDTASRIQETLRRFDLLDGAGKRTPRGSRTLKQHRYQPQKLATNLQQREEMYYPKY